MKNKGKQPGELRRLIEKVESEWREFRKNMLSDWKAFRKEWADKFNSSQDRIKQMANAIAQQLGMLNANQQVQSNAIERLDINTQAVAKAVERLYARIEVVDHYLEKDGPLEELTQEELLKVKKEADSVYVETMRDCFNQVHEERKAIIKQQREAARKARKEAEEAAKAKTEAKAAEEALQDAESRSKIVSDPGGEGADIPEGADVFGGEDAASDHGDQVPQAAQEG